MLSKNSHVFKYVFMFRHMCFQIVWITESSESDNKYRSKYQIIFTITLKRPDTKLKANSLTPCWLGLIRVASFNVFQMKLMRRTISINGTQGQ